jgi:hypothetical protein
MQRNKIIVGSAALLFLLVILLMAVYYFQNISVNEGSTVHSGVVNGLQLSLTLDTKTPTYIQGQIVSVTLALTNVNNQATNLSFISPDAYFDFSVYDNRSNFLIGQTDEGRFSTPTTLSPGQSIKETFQWSSTGHRGWEISDGVYQFVGVVRELNATELTGRDVFRTTPLNVTVITQPTASI